MTENQEALSVLKEILFTSYNLNPEEVTPDKAFAEDSEGANLGLDSLDVVELLISLEERYGIEISDEEAEKIATVGDAVEYLCRVLDKR